MSELPKIVHIDLRSLDGDYADLRYSEENLNDFEPRRLPLSEIQDLIATMERDYYVTLPENYATTGRRLYEWIDGSDRALSKRLEGAGTTVLAIALYQQSLAIKEQIGDVQGKAATLEMMGQLLADKKGDSETAISHLQESLAILQRIGSPDARTVQNILNRISP